EEHPLGVYHPHKELHHIKKENIGLIEVMGLAVLPARLNTEMADLEKAYLEGKDIRKDEVLSKHADWLDTFKDKIDKDPSKIHEIVQEEIGKVFSRVLEDAGVYKRDEKGLAAFDRFVNSI
ncbi:MAG: galactose-1-phosphate uridylyltransferase, partial [Lachnospiraceae bacterium]|nr:galactose-1-phosphate uridylyltransferase [Lachnospiraceae bacterium]